MAWDLNAQQALDNSPMLAGRDWTSAFAGTYGLAATSPSPSIASTPSWQAGTSGAGDDIGYNVGLPSAYASLSPNIHTFTSLPAITVTANVPSILDPQRDPSYAARLLDGQRAAFTQGLNAEADSHAQARQFAEVSARNAQRAESAALAQAKADGFFHDETVKLVTEPVQAIYGFIKDTPSQLNRLGTTLL